MSSLDLLSARHEPHGLLVGLEYRLASTSRAFLEWDPRSTTRGSPAVPEHRCPQVAFRRLRATARYRADSPHHVNDPKSPQLSAILGSDDTLLVDDDALTIGDLERTGIGENELTTLVHRLTLTVHPEVSRPLQDIAVLCLHHKESATTKRQVGIHSGVWASRPDMSWTVSATAT